nr:hypothetical protein [Mesorhizobium sp.]
MRGKPICRRPQDRRNAGVIGHNESRKQLRHVGDAAPLVAREQPDGQAPFVQDLTSRGKAQGDFAALGLVQASKISGIELDPAVAQLKPIARNETVNCPSLRSQKRRR